MVRTVGRSRIDILVDVPLVGRVVDLVRECEIGGHTIFPTLSGSGEGGTWTEDRVSEAEGKVMVMVLTSKPKAEALLAALEPLLDEWGLVVISGEAEVIRGTKFD